MGMLLLFLLATHSIPQQYNDILNPKCKILVLIRDKIRNLNFMSSTFKVLSIELIVYLKSKINNYSHGFLYINLCFALKVLGSDEPNSHIPHPSLVFDSMVCCIYVECSFNFISLCYCMLLSCCLGNLEFYFLLGIY